MSGKSGKETVAARAARISLRTILVRTCLAAYDAVVVNFGIFVAMLLGHDFRISQIPKEEMQVFLIMIPVMTVLVILIYSSLHLYRSVWIFASYKELLHLIIGTIGSWIGFILITCLILQPLSIVVYILAPVNQFFFTLVIRFGYRFVSMVRSGIRADRSVASDDSRRVMIIGAGNAARMLIQDMHRAKEISDVPVCIIDDDTHKWHCYIDDVEVVGGREHILSSVEKYHVNKIFFAIPSASPQEKRDILNICKETGCELKSLPGIFELVNGTVDVSQMKDVQVEDLLGRDPIKVEMGEIFDQIEGKVILVTGGGGSIGSELCRQIASHHPKQLIIFDIYENNAFEINNELKKKHPDLNLVTLIGSVRDSRRIISVMMRYKPQMVFHAAAHKHVPLMEDSPHESIKNNAIGTYKTAFAAMLAGVDRFVLISTDKAVNPTNIMGASKRLCEIIVQMFDAYVKQNRGWDIPYIMSHSISRTNKSVLAEILEQAKNGDIQIHTEYVAVRFGNVLGTNGSVIPIFKRQIAEGGPVTVTHKDIVRYFMTIPEAVSLVLQASTYAKGGEIFVLDMGEQVRIDDLARNLIRLSGHIPDVDIKIEYTGLRPGEKLFEEKLMNEEGLQVTRNKLIHVAKPLEWDYEKVHSDLKNLMDLSYDDTSDIKAAVQKVVPTYHPDNQNS